MSGDLDALLALYEASPNEIDRRMAAAVRTLRDQLDKSNARQRFYGKDAGHWQRKYLAERSRADFHCERADNLAKTSVDYDTALDAIPPWVLVERAIEVGALRATTSELAPGVGSVVYIRTALGRGPQLGPRESDLPVGSIERHMEGGDAQA